MARTYLDTARPIFALATAPGRAALAVIRVSGSSALELCGRCFSGLRSLSDARGYSMLHGFLVDPDSGERIDEVVASVFRGSRSFTGEDSVEFSCHGSPAVASRAFAALERAGLSPALPGEFTFRAFINGKTDLVRAEAIAELAGAQCESARADALARLSGALSSEYASLRDAMLNLLAEIEARLDYPEEEGPDDDEVPAPTAGGASAADKHDSASASAFPGLAALASCEARLERLSRSYLGGRLRQEGALVVVAGRPNAGKSSLFNLIAREERAIVSPEPGTTRDWLEAWIEIGGYAVRLVDTAGLRRVEEGVEAEGVRRSLDLSGRADVVVYLADGRAGLSPEDEEFIALHPDAITLWNKIDAPDCLPAPRGRNWLSISAKKGDRLASLEAAVKERLDGLAAGGNSGAPSGEVRLASGRQKILVDRCLESVRRAREGGMAGLPLDAIALDVREASDCLGEITGEIAGEEVFDRIFGSFCLGK